MLEFAFSHAAGRGGDDGGQERGLGFPIESFDSSGENIMD